MTMHNPNPTRQYSANGANAEVTAATTEQVRNKAHEVVDVAADRAESVERKLRAESAQAKAALQEKKEAAVGQFEKSVARVESFIKERPMAAAGIAFAAGVFASRIVRR